MQRTLRITGQGKVAVKPDLILFNFPVSVLNEDYEMALELLNERVSKLRNLVERAGIDIDGLKTTNYRISRDTRYDRDTEEHVFIGFRASHDIRLELPFDKKVVGEFIRTLSRHFQELDFRISFTAYQTEDLKRQLIENAIQNARQSAEHIAKASGITLKEILNIDFSFQELYLREESIIDSDMIQHDAMAMAEINPEDIEADKNITVTWRIE